MIVDALVGYKQPVFVYIPPHGMLRGGAWVVVDPTINRGSMEMFAAPAARGGVLEPSGIVEIKFRVAQRMEAARRLDPELRRLAAQRTALLQEQQQQQQQQQQNQQLLDADDDSAGMGGSGGGGRGGGGGGGDGAGLADIEAAMAEREQMLETTFLQVAQQFADLHDTPGRMAAKGVISGVVPFKRARSFFYWRLRRRLAEFSLRRQVSEVAGLGAEETETVLRDLFLKSRTAQYGGQGGRAGGQPAWMAYASSPVPSVAPSGQGGKGASDAAQWEDDKLCLQWLSEEYASITAAIRRMRRSHIQDQVVNLGLEDPTALVNGTLELIEQLSPEAKAKVIAALRRGVIFVDPSGQKKQVTD